MWDDCDREACARLRRPSSLCPLSDLSGSGAPPRSKVDEKQQSHRLPGGCHAGELTLTGTQQAHRLGQLLRERYASLLQPAAGEDADVASRITVRSTNVSRCVLTARAVLAGLVGDTSPSPIAIRTVRNEDEDLTPAAARCARLAELWDEARHEWRDDANSMHRSMPRVTEHLRRVMGEEAFEAYGIDEGRWVPLKDVLYAIGALPSRPPLPWNISPDLLKEVNALAGAQVGHMMGEGRSMRYQAEVTLTLTLTSGRGTPAKRRRHGITWHERAYHEQRYTELPTLPPTLC